jgi:hypothetical protein
MIDPKNPEVRLAVVSAVVAKAVEVCRWVDWIDDPRAKAAVVELKAQIEGATGKEICVYN